VLDRVKEAIFGSLGGRVRDEHVLDLYAGSGQMALEALSRGAARATLVESDPAARAAIARNIAACGAEDLVRVPPGDVQRFLAGPPDPAAVVFCDPPYALPVSAVEAVLVALAPWVEDDGIVVLRRHVSEQPWEPPVAFAAVRRRRYGDTAVIDLVPVPQGDTRVEGAADAQGALPGEL
jgi:16S rRNA (guanine966-N2)-methyltransferase